jgi:aryl-alcohol dehydrogenase-like predicted oxidoreductase
MHTAFVTHAKVVFQNLSWVLESFQQRAVWPIIFVLCDICSLRKVSFPMEYRKLGNSGLLVSRLSLGTMTFAQGNKSLPTIYKVERALADRMVGTALDAGINFFDTADAYAQGESEEMLGSLLGSKRKDQVIATKVGFRSGNSLFESGLSRRHILDSVDQSLRRLGTDWIDLYIAHREDPFTPLEETLETMDSLVRMGKVRYLGFSNWSAWKVSAALEMQRANHWAPFINGQMYYSLISRDIERDFLPMMKHYGVGLTIWSPLAGGFLSGKYRRDNLQDDEHRLSGFDIIPFDKDKGFALLEHLQNIATQHKVTIAQLAIRWLLYRDQVSSVIIGSSKLHQLENNLAAISCSLSPDEILAIEELTVLDPVYPTWFIDRMVDDVVRKALLPMNG